MYTKRIPMYIFTWYIISEALPFIILSETDYLINFIIRLVIMSIATIYFESLLNKRIEKIKEKNK